jgi:hypothetical protein
MQLYKQLSVMLRMELIMSFLRIYVPSSIRTGNRTRRVAIRIRRIRRMMISTTKQITSCVSRTKVAPGQFFEVKTHIAGVRIHTIFPLFLRTFHMAQIVSWNETPRKRKIVCAKTVCEEMGRLKNVEWPSLVIGELFLVEHAPTACFLVKQSIVRCLLVSKAARCSR